MASSASTTAGVVFAAAAAVSSLVMYMRKQGKAKRAMTLMRFAPTAAQIEAKADEVIALHKATLDAVAAVKSADATFETVVQPLMDLEEAINVPASFIRFPKNVASVRAERDASTAAWLRVSNYLNGAKMRMDVFKAVKAYYDSNKPRPTGERLRFLEHTMRDFRRAGLTLSQEDRDKVEALDKKISQAGVKFSQNIAEDDTKLYFTKEELDGLEDSFISSLDKNDAGKYELTLAYPHYVPVMDQCKVEETRKQMLIAFDSRAMKDNVKLLEDTLLNRCKRAKLLGYDSHSHYKLEVTMAKSPDKVLGLLRPLLKRLQPAADKEKAAYLAAKRKDQGDSADTQLYKWDIRFYQHKLVEEQYKIDYESIRQYFPLDAVTKGMLQIYQELLGLTYTQVKNPHVWHSDVTMYEVRNDDAKGALLGYFYLDLHPRPGKYTHACCCPLQTGCEPTADGGRRRIATAGMLANFTAPTADKPSLLSHTEVVTFFHEFGHVMHHICSAAETVSFSGFGCEHDFVEAPSQMLENWCWRAEALARMSEHVKTKAPLPKDLAEKLASTELANVATLTQRQLYFGLFDQEIHSITDATTRVDTAAVLKRLDEEVLALPTVDGTNFVAAFGHMMGGYDAGYYGYMWSDVFAADMFATRFEKEGLFNPKTGGDYRKHILGSGGAIDAMDFLTAFLGRAPNDAAFLESKGLTDKSSASGAGAGAGAGAATDDAQ